MARSVDELLELIEAGDDEAKEELRNVLAVSKQEAASRARELRLKTDNALKDRYPRALRAYEKGRLKLGGDLSDDDLIAALADKEEELAELGVPLGDALVPSGNTGSGDDTDDGTDDESAPDPAKALAGGRAASSPGGQPRDLVGEAIEAYKKATTEHDLAKAHSILVELNKNPATRGKVDLITKALEARPIAPLTI